MRLGILALLTCIACWSCATKFDTDDMSKLYPSLDGNKFTFITFASPMLKEDTEYGESMRIEVLERYLKANSLCEAGYKVATRQVIHKPPKGDKPRTEKTIIYHGECL